MDTHADDFIEQRPGLVQPIIRRATGRGEGSTAFFAAIAPASALLGDVEGVSDDVALAELSFQAAIGVGTSAIGLLAPLLHVLMTDNRQEVQVGS